MADVLLRVEHLKQFFPSGRSVLHAVDDVSFTIERGRTLGVVGESGCGKSTLGRSILRLIEPTGGRVVFDGTDMSTLHRRALRRARKDMQIIFQDPFSSVDPRKTVFQIISESITTQRLMTGRKEIEKRVLALMETVGLAERLVNTYPHELDGGRRQRIGIARALAMNPKFIVCDEPVSALDVSIQAQILNLLRKLQREHGLTYLFITHDLAVVHHLADEIIVMYLGRIVEKAPAMELFEHPMHPYTQALLSAIPIPEIVSDRKRIILKGEISSPIDPPDECRFAGRCFRSCEKCRAHEPELTEVRPGHYVSCYFPENERI